MRVARSSGWTSAARRRTASLSLARAARPRARTSSIWSVLSMGAWSMRMTYCRYRARERTSATLAAWATLDTKSTFDSLSFRM